MPSIMPRVAAISAVLRSARPRGRRAFSLFVLWGLSAIIGLESRVPVVAVGPRSGKRASKQRPFTSSEPIRGKPDVFSFHAEGKRGAQRFAIVLAAVHAQSRLQG